jgi:hypothetical protein
MTNEAFHPTGIATLLLLKVQRDQERHSTERHILKCTTFPTTKNDACPARAFLGWMSITKIGRAVRLLGLPCGWRTPMLHYMKTIILKLSSTFLLLGYSGKNLNGGKSYLPTGRVMYFVTYMNTLHI